MRTLPSGHRLVELCDWKGETFPISDEVSQKYELSGEAFSLMAISSPCAEKGALRSPHVHDPEHQLPCQECQHEHVGVRKPLYSLPHVHEDASSIDEKDVQLSLEQPHVCHALEKNFAVEKQFEQLESPMTVHVSSEIARCENSENSFEPSFGLSSSGERISQFDFSEPSLGVTSHGSLRAASGHTSMGAAHLSGARHDLGRPPGLPDPGNRGEDQEEHQIRQRFSCPLYRGADQMPTSSRATDPQGKQVCFMDGVQDVRCSPKLQEQQHQGDQDEDSTRNLQQVTHVHECDIIPSGCSNTSKHSSSEHTQSDPRLWHSGDNAQSRRVSEKTSSLGPASGKLSGQLHGEDSCRRAGAGCPTTDHHATTCHGNGAAASRSVLHATSDGKSTTHSSNQVSGSDESEPSSRSDHSGGRGRHLGAHQSQRGGRTLKALAMTLLMQTSETLAVQVQRGGSLSSSQLFFNFDQANEEFNRTEETLSRNVDSECLHSVCEKGDHSSACEIGDSECQSLEEMLMSLNMQRTGREHPLQHCCESQSVAWCAELEPGKPIRDIPSMVLCQVTWYEVRCQSGALVRSGSQLSNSMIAEIYNDCPSRQFSLTLWFMSNDKGKDNVFEVHREDEPLDMVWLGGSQPRRLRSHLRKLCGTKAKTAFAELFSPSRVSPYIKSLGLPLAPQSSFDLTEGWNVHKGADRQSFWKFLREQQPEHLHASPECRRYSQIMNLNWNKMTEESQRSMILDAEAQWSFSVEACLEQARQGRYFSLEHPAYASSWEEPDTQRLEQLPDSVSIIFDQCCLGLQVCEEGLSRKSTRVMTNNPHLAMALSSYQCNGEHRHAILKGGTRTKQAQKYPHALCQVIAENAALVFNRTPVPSFEQLYSKEVFAGDLEEGNEDEEEENSGIGNTSASLESGQITDKQKRLLHRVHVNSGHPNREQFLRLLKAAGCREPLLKYVKDKYHCSHCDLQRGPAPRRRAQMPKTFQFNRIVGVDVLYVNMTNLRVPILNAVRVGTNLQIAVRLNIPPGLTGGTPTSETCWKGFAESWIRYFGAPGMIITDPGNEFKGRFERGCEFFGIYQHVTHPESPWENGRAERHGGWLKQRLESEIASGRSILEKVEDIDEYLAELCSCKNRWFCREGFTPFQLAFGEQPRLPHDLLSDHVTGQQGLRDVFEDPLGVDSAAGEFRRKLAIQEAARHRAMKQASQECVSRAVKSTMHQVKHWSPGQWVYVFRRGRPNNELHPRDRWVGPGIVVLANNETVFVGMRTRLWRCSSSQLRPALPAEILGREVASDPGLRELLHRVTSGSRAGAVPVDSEGPPPQGHELLPVQQTDGVGELDGPGPSDHQPHPELPRIPEASTSSPPTRPLTPSPATEEAESSRRRPRPEGDRGPGQDRTLRRRVSDSTSEEPVQEPTPTGSQDLPPIREESMRSSSTSDSSSSSTSSTSQPLGDDSEIRPDVSRAPGTPVQPLLSRIPREAPQSSSGSGLTPGEELGAAGRVSTQVEEFERLSQPRTLLPQPAHEEPTDAEAAMEEFTFFTEGWSGKLQDYQRGSQQLCFEDGEWVFLAKRNSETDVNKLPKHEQELFKASDAAEWQAIADTGAVKVHVGEAARRLRELHADRILSSRMVRRKKPIPGIGKWKPKSRWCVHGHPRPCFVHICPVHTLVRTLYDPDLYIWLFCSKFTHFHAQKCLELEP